VRPSPLPGSVSARSIHAARQPVEQIGVAVHAAVGQPDCQAVPVFIASPDQRQDCRRPIRRRPGSRLSRLTPGSTSRIVKATPGPFLTGKRRPPAEPTPAALADRQHQRLRRLQVDGDVVGDLGGKTNRSRFVEARTVDIHGQVVVPAGSIRLFLPALVAPLAQAVVAGGGAFSSSRRCLISSRDGIGRPVTVTISSADRPACIMASIWRICSSVSGG
jgi:hypothetical protein